MRPPSSPPGAGETPGGFPPLPADLEPLARQLSARRVRRMREVLARRLGSVAVVAEAVRRRHNVSAILRSADAFGLHHVHLITGRFRPSPGAARGSERWLQLTLHPDTPLCIRHLRDRGYRIYAADLAPEGFAPDRLPVDRPLAILFGGELAGVSAEAREQVDGFVAVPMQGFVESLNVSAAAAVILHTVAERRRALTGPDLAPAERLQALRTWLERDVRTHAAAARRHGSPPASGSPSAGT